MPSPGGCPKQTCCSALLFDLENEKSLVLCRLWVGFFLLAFFFFFLFFFFFPSAAAWLERPQPLGCLFPSFLLHWLSAVTRC